MIETNVTKMLGIEHPILSAPMGPFYTVKLATAVSKAGGLGVLSHTNLYGKSSIEEMMRNMDEVVSNTEKPFGLNIRTARMQPDAMDLCRRIPKYIMKSENSEKLIKQCSYALTSAGSPKMLPKSKTWTALKEIGSNIKHFHVAPTLELAEKCISAGVDGLVVTGTEGGGHQSYEKISTLVLLQQIRDKHPEVPVIACGGFATGEGLASALTLGAGAIAMGSRFIACVESEFHQAYKDIVPSAKAEDTDLVTGFLGPIRLWKNAYCKSHGLVANKEAKMSEEQNFSAEDLIEDQKHYEMIYNGDIENGAVLLGQSIGIIDSIETVENIIKKIIADAEKTLKASCGIIK
jgi:enoyl-[acyl-carrier protein] reductase II